MSELLKRLMSPEYLVVADPGPLGGLWVLYVALGMLFVTGLVMSLRLLFHRRRQSSTTALKAWAWFEAWVCLAGLGAVVGRFLGWYGWSARIWPYSLAALALAGLLAYRLRQVRLPTWLAVQLHILIFSPPPFEPAATPDLAAFPSGLEGPKARRPFHPLLLLILAVHLVGIGFVLGTRYGYPFWTAPLVLVSLHLPLTPLLFQPRLSRPWNIALLALMALTPLFAAYAATFLWLLYRWLGITIVSWQGLAFPNPLVSLFYVDAIVLAAITYALLCQLGLASQERKSPAILWRGAVVGLLVVTLAWVGVVYFGKRTHGATASDPYAYAQMGVDLAEHGTFLHRFSLFQAVIPLDIAWAPLQPVGYHIPRSELGDCPSVWATGAAVLLAAGYALCGEAGLYVTTPIMAILALAATWALVQEALRGQPKTVRYIAGALTVTLLATSPEHVDRLLVPMADAPSQLFTVLTLFFALRGMHQLETQERSFCSFLCAGACFAWAYWVRHTQLLLALPLILAVMLGRRSQRQRSPRSSARLSSSLVFPLLLFFAAALAVAVPDILYRWQVFGGPFATETTELPLMSLQHIGPVAWQMLRDTLAAGEWGYLFPLAIYGGYRLARERGREAAVLGSAFLAVLLVHLTYRSLRLRDLISLFPLLDLAVAYGTVTLVRRVRKVAVRRDARVRFGAALFPVVVITWVLLCLALSRWAMIDNLWKRGWASFGYMRAEHRAAFDRLAQLTPSEAIISASLNSGAIMMYTARDAIRPYDSWTDEEWDVFLGAMRDQGRPVYLLDDGGLMAAFIDKVRTRHQLVPIAALEVPLFYTQDRETGWLYRLEWDQ